LTGALAPVNTSSEKLKMSLKEGGGSYFDERLKEHMNVKKK